MMAKKQTSKPREKKLTVTGGPDSPEPPLPSDLIPTFWPHFGDGQYRHIFYDDDIAHILSAVRAVKPDLEQEREFELIEDVHFAVRDLNYQRIGMMSNELSALHDAWENFCEIWIKLSSDTRNHIFTLLAQYARWQVEESVPGETVEDTYRRQFKRSFQIMGLMFGGILGGGEGLIRISKRKRGKPKNTAIRKVIRNLGQIWEQYTGRPSTHIMINPMKSVASDAKASLSYFGKFVLAVLGPLEPGINPSTLDHYRPRPNTPKSDLGKIHDEIRAYLASLSVEGLRELIAWTDAKLSADADSEQ